MYLNVSWLYIEVYVHNGWSYLQDGWLEGVFNYMYLQGAAVVPTGGVAVLAGVKRGSCAYKVVVLTVAMVVPTEGVVVLMGWGGGVVVLTGGVVVLAGGGVGVVVLTGGVPVAL